MTDNTMSENKRDKRTSKTLHILTLKEEMNSGAPNLSKRITYLPTFLISLKILLSYLRMRNWIK